MEFPPTNSKPIITSFFSPKISEIEKDKKIGKFDNSKTIISASPLPSTNKFTSNNLEMENTSLDKVPPVLQPVPFLFSQPFSQQIVPQVTPDQSVPQPISQPAPVQPVPQVAPVQPFPQPISQVAPVQSIAQPISQIAPVQPIPQITTAQPIPQPIPYVAPVQTVPQPKIEISSELSISSITSSKNSNLTAILSPIVNTPKSESDKSIIKTSKVLTNTSPVISSKLISPINDSNNPIPINNINPLLAIPEDSGKIIHFPDFKHHSFISFLEIDSTLPIKMKTFYETDSNKSFYSNCLNYNSEKIRIEVNSCLDYLKKKTNLYQPEFFSKLILNISSKPSISRNIDSSSKNPKDEHSVKQQEGIISDINSNTLMFYKNKQDVNIKFITDGKQYEAVEGGLMFIVGKESLISEMGELLPGSILLFGNYFIPELQKQIYFRSTKSVYHSGDTMIAFLSIMIDNKEWALQTRTYFKSKNCGRRGYLMHSLVTY